MTKYDIYLIWGKDQDGNILRYYGSTANFIKRKSQHKNHYKRWVKAGRPNNKKCSAYFIIDNGDWKMEKIDEIIGDRWEARKLEGEYQKNNDCVNIQIASRTKKEWKEDNKKKIVEKNKQYYETHKDELIKKKKQYYETHKDKFSEKHKIYNNKNKDKIAEQKKDYYEKNKNEFLEKYRKNKNEISEKRKEKYKKNKNEILEKLREKYKKNKNEILEKRKEKIICECGAESTKNYIYKHRKTKKHINLLSNNELNV